MAPQFHMLHLILAIFRLPFLQIQLSAERSQLIRVISSAGGRRDTLRDEWGELSKHQQWFRRSRSIVECVNLPRSPRD